MQSLAHIAKRLLSSKNAMMLSAIASGFVSSTATVASLGMEVRAGRANAKHNAGVRTDVWCCYTIAITDYCGWSEHAVAKKHCDCYSHRHSCFGNLCMALIKRCSLITPNQDLDSRMFSLKEACNYRLNLNADSSRSLRA